MSPRWVFGLQPAREAIAVHGSKVRLFVERRAAREAAEQLEALARFATDRGAAVERLERSELDRLAHGVRHQGVALQAPPLRVLDLQELLAQLGERPDRAPLLVALDEITDPQNFGAVVRSVVALGGSAVIWPEERSAPLSATTERASAGAIEHAQLVRVPGLTTALQTLVGAGFTVIGLDGQAKVALSELALHGPTCLVVGSEGTGLRRGTKKACTHLAKLPMNGPIASLNASVAGALALYEVGRQRGFVRGTNPER